MLASLKKDFYTIRGYCRYILIVIILFTAIPYVTGSETTVFYALFPRMFAGLIPLTLYTYDEREHWCSYAATLPISRTVYVLGKYLLGIILTAALSILNLVLDLAVGAAGLPGVEMSFGIGVALSLVIPALTMPFLFRFGAEKGRIIYLIAVGFGSAGSVIFFDDMPEVNPVSDLGIVAGTLAVYAVSAVLSVMFYKKREL